MKYVLVVIGLLFGTYAEAEEPTKSDLDAFVAAIENEQENDMWFFQTGKPCFFEHICTMGPIGKRPDCESRIEICLIQASEDRDELSEILYNRNCRPLFAELTPAQNQMIAAPKFCEAPPPRIAFRPTLAESEVDCYCKSYNKMMSLEGPASYERCLRDVDNCTRSMSGLTGPDRVRCRKKRDIALGGTLLGLAAQHLAAAKSHWIILFFGTKTNRLWI